ncbi:hypothetical protein U9R90_06690, partial [Streptomyces sp. E11-3]
MGESVPVHCPACRREHLYAPPAFPCSCGEPVAPPVRRGVAPVPITHRTWADDWVTVRCPACGRHDQWPQPELGCACGAVLRIPIRPVADRPDTPDTPQRPQRPQRPDPDSSSVFDAESSPPAP